MAYGTPSRSRRAPPGARPSVYACRTSSVGVPRRGRSTRAPALGPRRCPCRPRIRSGTYPSSSSASAPPSTPDEHRPDVADVGAQRGQVLAVAVPADHDEDGPAREVVPELGQARPAEEQVALLCAGTRGCSARSSRTAVRARPGRSPCREATEAWLWRIPTATSRSPTNSRSPDSRRTSPSRTFVMSSGPTRSISGMPGLDQDQRAEVRVPAADRRRGVHHRRDTGVDQPLGRHAVEVLVVDHRDVPGLRPWAPGPSCAGRPARRLPRAHVCWTSGAGLGSWTWTCGTPFRSWPPSGPVRDDLRAGSDGRCAPDAASRGGPSRRVAHACGGRATHGPRAVRTSPRPRPATPTPSPGALRRA